MIRKTKRDKHDKESKKDKYDKEDKKKKIKKKKKKELMFRRLIVFGSTGDTGRQFVRLALKAGHNVTCFVRTPSKFTEKHENLKVIQGNVDNRGAVLTAMKDHDAIVSCLGIHGSTFWNKTKLYTSSMDSFVAGMKSTGISRILSITSWYTQLEREKSNPTWIEWLGKPLLFGGFIYDMGQMEVNLSKTEGIDFTVIRPPGLSNDPSKGRTRIAVDRYFVENCDLYIPRVDVAQFMVESLQTNQYNRKCVSIGSASKN